METFIHFTLNGIQYRTNGKIVEGKDGETWNATGSLAVVLHARKVHEASIRKNRARRERDQAMRDLGLVKVRGNLGGTYWE